MPLPISVEAQAADVPGSVPSIYAARIRQCLEALAADDALPRDLMGSRPFTVAFADDEAHGDLVSNVALMLAKPSSLSTQDLGCMIIARLGAFDDIERVTLAGPGFINLTLKAQVWHDVLKDILNQRDDFGRSTLGAGQGVRIEGGALVPAYSSDLTQIRRLVFCDALANILQFSGFQPQCHYNVLGSDGIHSTGDMLNRLGIDQSRVHLQVLTDQTMEKAQLGPTAVKILGQGRGQIDVKQCQSVCVYRNGRSETQKQQPKVVSCGDFVDEIGLGALRFMLLYRKSDSILDFDCDRVRELSNDNPVFYVQYAHARACSVLTKAEQRFPDLKMTGKALSKAQLGLLTDKAEIALIKKLSQFPSVIEAARLAHDPHCVAFFVHELASRFHRLWTRGKELPHLGFMVESSRDLTQARIALTKAAANVLRKALGLLGVTALSEMR